MRAMMLNHTLSVLPWFLKSSLVPPARWYMPLAWKKELPWLAECDSIALQQSLRNVDRAWQSYFKFPEHFDRRLPSIDSSMIAFVSAATLRPKRSVAASAPAARGRARSPATPSAARQTSGTCRCHARWEWSLRPPAGRALRWASPVTPHLATAHTRDSVHTFNNNQRQLARLQRAFARRTKGSNRRRKMVMRVAKQHARIAFIRADQHTSHRCQACGRIARDNRVSQAAFKCIACAHVDQADVNAAKNIRDSVGTPREESTRRRRPANETHQQEAEWLAGIPAL